MTSHTEPNARPPELVATDDDGLSLLQLWSAVRKNWVLVAGVTAAVLLAATFYTLGRTKIYRSSTTIQIDPTPPKPLGQEVQTVVDMGAGMFWSNKEYYRTQYKIIQSRRTAEQTVRTLGLHRDPGFLGNVPPGEKPPPREVSVQSAAKVLLGRLHVEPVQDSRLVTVSFEDADPVRAQRVLTGVADTYVEQNLDTVLESTGSAADWLGSQLEKLKKELESNEIELHEYKKNKQILSVSIDDQSNMLADEMKHLNEALTRVKTEQQRIAAKQAELAKIDPKDPADLPAKELLENDLLQNLREEYVNAKREVESLRGSGKGPAHPRVKAASARVEATRDALISEVRNIQGALDRELAAIKREAASLRGLFENAKQRAMELNRLEIEYNRLLRSKDNTEKLYSLVLERAKESDLTRMMRFNNLRVVDQAQVPKSPVRPNLPLSVAVGFAGGLVFGVGLAIGRELLDRSIKTPDDVEKQLGLSFLGLLPAYDGRKTAGSYYSRRRRKRERRLADSEASGAPELLVHEAPSSGVAEAARAVRTNILFMSPDNPYRRLLVTSAGPTEGKTTVSSALAIAMAQAGQRVLLVDCDLRRPRIHRIFGKANDVGVSTVLLDHSVLGTASLETEVPNLSVLPSGPHVPNPAELLQSDSFARLLDELGDRYDRIVLDSPPVIPVTDGAVLATRVDGTILVVRAFKTSRDFARQGARALRDVGVRVVGVVLNAVDPGRRQYGHYQYYYQYKREGYGDASQSSRDAADAA